MHLKKILLFCDYSKYSENFQLTIKGKNVKKNFLQSPKQIIRHSLYCFSFFLLLFAAVQAHSQNPQCQWAEKIAGNSYDYAYSIITDESGNVYVAGSFDSPMLAFNNGITLSNSGDYDGYIAKYNSDGVCQWAEKIAGKGYDYVFSISTDINGNVYVAGYFKSSKLRFNNGIILTKSADVAGYIAKYNSDGVCQWAEKIAGTDGDYARSISTDLSGNVYVTGYFHSNKLTFNNGITLSNIGASDSYIAKYNSDGVCQWAEKIAGIDRDYLLSISADLSGNVYVAGYFDSPILTFNCEIMLLNTSVGDGFIAKYNSDGVCQWAEKIAGSNAESTHSIITDASANVYVAGYFSSKTLTFNNGITLSNNGYFDGFIAKYNSDGVCQWAEKIAGSNADNEHSISTDASANIYVAGWFSYSTLTFNNGITLSKSGYRDAYLAKYNSDGVCQWAEKIAGTNFDRARSINTDANGNVYVAGDFSSDTLTFNNGITLSNVSTFGQWDSFIAKYVDSETHVNPDFSSSSNNEIDQPLFLSPNPVKNNSLNIAFNLLTPEQVTIKIANMLGEVVSVVKSNELFPHGEHSSNVDISNFPAGAYFCILRFKDKVYQQKFIRY